MKTLRACTGGLVACTLIALHCSGQQWDWVHRLQGDSSSGSRIGLDQAGNVYFTGSFTGTNRLGTNELVSAGAGDLFLARLSATGAVIWAIGFGGTNDDVLTDMSVATNGAVFVSGRFTVPSSLLTASNGLDAVTNVCLARIDEGRFAWLETCPPEVSMSGVAVGENSLYAYGGSNRVFVRRYDWDGALHDSFVIGNTNFVPGAIEVGSNGLLFVTGQFSSLVDFGTTNIPPSWSSEHLLAALNSTGTVQWVWSAGAYIYGNPITDISATPDGGVVSIHLWDTGLPQGYTSTVKHAPDGTIAWTDDHTGHFKSVYDGYGATADPRGNIHVVGQAWASIHYGTRQDSLWLYTLDPSGNPLTEQFVISTNWHDSEAGSDVAANEYGDLFVTGRLSGAPRFGTNLMGVGPSGIANAFVGRRRTLQPALTFRVSSTNIVLSWPRTALPFGLQQSTTLSSNDWMFVGLVPNENTGRKVVTLPMSEPSQFFRLMRTNEVPIRHPPNFYQFSVLPSSSFLGRPFVFLTSSNSAGTPSITGWADDPDEDELSFQWYLAETGQELTNGTSSQLYYTEEWVPYYTATLDDTNLVLAAGTNTIQLVTSDSYFFVTNSVSIEVLTLPTAIDQLSAAVMAATSALEGARLTAPLPFARAALLSGDGTTATARLTEFKDLVATSPELSQVQKDLFIGAANQIIAAIGPS